MDLSDLNRDELRTLASKQRIPGRGSMNKSELLEAIQATLVVDLEPETVEAIKQVQATVPAPTVNLPYTAASSGMRSCKGGLSGKPYNQARNLRRAQRLTA